MIRLFHKGVNHAPAMPGIKRKALNEIDHTTFSIGFILVFTSAPPCEVNRSEIAERFRRVKNRRPGTRQFVRSPLRKLPDG